MLGVGIGWNGQRELSGLHLAYGETEGGWRRFIKQLKQRGLAGVVARRFLRMATSNAHEGLRQAVEAAFSGVIWQRCHAEESLDRGPHRCALSEKRHRPDAACAAGSNARSAGCHPEGVDAGPGP